MKREVSGISSIILCLFFTFSPVALERVHASTRQVQKVREWHAMGSSPCAWLATGNLPYDVGPDETVKELRSAGLQCAVILIGNPGRAFTYYKFQKLLEATKSTDIAMWAVILPPSERPISLPYGSDYVAWSRSLANLSLKYKNFRGFNIDDLDTPANDKTFTRDYLDKIYAAKKEVNPRFLFVPTVYGLDPAIADRLAGRVDGVWLWWVNLEALNGMPASLENSRYPVAGRFPIYGGVYAHPTSWHKGGSPNPVVFRQSLEDACKYTDGAVIWQLSLAPSDPLLAVTKTFLPGGSSTYAGKCGAGTAQER